MVALHAKIDLHCEYALTYHAWTRMSHRGHDAAALEDVLQYGRAVHVRGATIYVIGRKEVARYRREGIDLQAHEGLQVVCHQSGHVLTVYRNRDLRGLRPRTARAARRRRHA